MALRQGNVMNELVISSLHEGRVDVTHGDEALSSHTRGEGHRVLLGNPYVKGALGILLHHIGHRAARRHSRSYRNDTLIHIRQLN